MRVTGIICEYNPFHNGHKYHIEQTKHICSADYIIGIMSGSFTQRGTPAITDKYNRTKTALSNGCDIVIELPVRYATSSAEGFAHGAINTLKATNVADSICFGTEEGSLEHFNTLAEIIENEPHLYKNILSDALKSGMTYPQARNKALKEYLSAVTSSNVVSDCKSSDKIISADISQPNNILAIEYLRACKKTGITPYTIKRTDAGYHVTSFSEHSAATLSSDNLCCSASAIRNALSEIHNSNNANNSNDTGNHNYNNYNNHNNYDDIIFLLNKYLPYEITSHLSKPMNENDFSMQLYMALSSNTDYLNSYLDISDDLAARIKNNMTSYESWTQFITLLKTKQMTYTRIQRALCHCMLSISDAKISGDYPAPYIRILGFKKNAGKLLKQITNHSAVPVITKASTIHSIHDSLTKKMLSEDIYATELYNKTYAYKYSLTGLPNEYTHGVVIVD